MARFAPSAVSPAAWAEPVALRGNALSRLAAGIVAMAQAELRKLRHDHLDIFTRSVQPLLWLFIFGTALRHNRALSSGAQDYRAYLNLGRFRNALVLDEEKRRPTRSLSQFIGNYGLRAYKVK